MVNGKPAITPSLLFICASTVENQDCILCGNCWITYPKSPGDNSTSLEARRSVFQEVASLPTRITSFRKPVPTCVDAPPRNNPRRGSLANQPNIVRLGLLRSPAFGEERPNPPHKLRKATKPPGFE